MRFVAVICVLLLISSCGKEESNIPYVFVDIRIPVVKFERENKDGSLLVNGGVAGIIIHKDIFGNGYVAYDRCSTVNPEKKCAIIVDDGGLTATDPCSKAVFSLQDGSPQKEPAKKRLKQYQVTVINNLTIQVSN